MCSRGGRYFDTRALRKLAPAAGPRGGAGYLFDDKVSSKNSHPEAGHSEAQRKGQRRPEFLHWGWLSHSGL
jgi:hypothetical protein